MELEKLPFLDKQEYDTLIRNQLMCRISFQGDKYPQIKPFLYVFDGEYIYFLASKYGKKLQYIQDNPDVTIEIEDYSEDLSKFKFVTLSGKLETIQDEKEKKKIRQKFAQLIKDKNLSKNVLLALGYSTEDPVEAIVKEDKTIVLKFVKVEKITGFKDS